MKPDLDTMLEGCDAALLIGDSALIEAVQHRELDGRTPLVTDLGEAWYALTRLPFTFAVWASRKDNPPSEKLVSELRRVREIGLGHLAAVSEAEADHLGIAPLVIQRYLNNFRYYLEPPDRDGLLTFAQKSLGEEVRFEFWAL